MSAGLSQLLGEREIATFARIADTKRFDDLGKVFAVDVAYDYGRRGPTWLGGVAIAAKSRLVTSALVT
jgi:hypothetical protein